MSEGNNYRTVSSRRVLREARGLLKKDRSFWLRVYLFMLLPFCACGTFLLAIPLFAVNAFAGVSAILARSGVGASIRTAWKFLRDNLSSVIRLGLLLFLVMIGILIVSAILSAPFSIAASVPAQRALMDCIEQVSDPTQIQACISQTQQSPALWISQLLNTLITTLVNLVGGLIMLISASLLFLHLRPAEQTELIPDGSEDMSK